MVKNGSAARAATSGLMPGPLSITVEVTGDFADDEAPMTRAGGAGGDDIYVTGALGDAAGGLEWLTASGQDLSVATSDAPGSAASELVERYLRPFHAEDPEGRLWRSSEDRQRCATLADECRTLLAEVVAMERDQERRIQGHRNALAGQLQQAGKAQQAIEAYRQQQADLPQARPPVAPVDSTGSTTRLDPGCPVR